MKTPPVPLAVVLLAGTLSAQTVDSSPVQLDATQPVPGRTFTPTAPLGGPRGAHTSTLLPSGAVLVLGGGDPNGNALQTAEFYTP